MTPVYCNGNDYYKKMLELQRRLRRSEEERIRLEERFSLLEQESRSRHETCINRLRMRYIEFLEEQQARDKRNHQLLGALDRVDSSLALISAKTDRLGNIRRQNEAASLLKNWYINRRANGSVAGDSGVASQNNESQGRGSKHYERVLFNKHEANIPRIVLGSIGSLGNTRGNYSPRKESSDSYYNARRAVIGRYAGLQMAPQSSTLSSASHKGQASTINDVDTRDRVEYFVGNRPTSESQLIPRFSRGGNRLNSPDFTSGVYQSTSGQFPLRSLNSALLRYSRDAGENQRVARADSLGKDVYRKITPVQNYPGLFESDLSSPTARSPSRFPRTLFESSSRDPDEEVYHVGGLVENELERYMRRIPRLHREAEHPQSPEELDQEQNTSGDLLNVTLSDDDVDFSAEAKFGHVQSLSKRDSAVRQHDFGGNKVATVCQNASPGEAGNSQQAGEVTAAEGRGLLESQHEKILLGNRDSAAISSPSNLGDIDDHKMAARNEKMASLVKNGSMDESIARDDIESGERPLGNKENVGKSRDINEQEIGAIEPRLIMSSEEKIDARLRGSSLAGGTKIDPSLVGNGLEKVNAESRSAKPEELHRSNYKLVSGEERDTGNHFREYLEDLEPWNLSALERRIQGSMIIEDASAPEPNFVQNGSKQVPNSPKLSEQEREIDVMRTGGVGDGLYSDERRIDEHMAAGDEKYLGNVETSWKNEPDAAGGKPVGNLSEVEQQEEVSNRGQEYKHDTESSLVNAEESMDPSTGKYAADEFQEPIGAREANQQNYQQDNHQQDNYQQDVDPNVEYVARSENSPYANQESALYSQEEYAQDPNQQYEYPVDGQYQEGLNEEQYQAQQYLQNNGLGNNVLYDGDPNAEQQYQYELDQQQQYQGYNIGEHDPQYSADPGLEYAVNPDPNGPYEAGDYMQDPNQAYSGISATDGNAPEAQEYAANEFYGQNGLPVNEGYVTEADYNQGYGQGLEMSAEANQSQGYAQEYEAPVELDHGQGYGQDHDQAMIESGGNQSYGQGHDQAMIESDGNQSYGQGHDQAMIESSGNQSYGQGHDQAMIESGGNQSYGQGHDQAMIESDGNQVYGQGHDASEAFEPQTKIVEDQSGKKLLDGDELVESINVDEVNVVKTEAATGKKTKDVIKSLLDSDTESTIEKNVSNAESDFDFN